MPFSHTIFPNKYTSVKKNVIDSLSAATHCSLTTDLWTGYHRRSYMLVTALHNLRMGNEALLSTDTWNWREAHCGKLSCKAVLKEWRLESKAYGCTTDNASNITNAIAKHMSLVYLPYTAAQCSTRSPSTIHCTSIRQMQEVSSVVSQVNTTHL